MTDEPETPTPAAELTFPVAEGARRLGVSEDWYIRQLRAKRLPGHKLGRGWKLTESDVQQALDLTYVAAVEGDKPDPAGLSRGSRQRRIAARRRSA